MNAVNQDLDDIIKAKRQQSANENVNENANANADQDDKPRVQVPPQASDNSDDERFDGEDDEEEEYFQNVIKEDCYKNAVSEEKNDKWATFMNARTLHDDHMEQIEGNAYCVAFCCSFSRAVLANVFIRAVAGGKEPKGTKEGDFQGHCGLH